MFGWSVAKHRFLENYDANMEAHTISQISQHELAEDTIWWSIKGATEYAAHRRTVLLFHQNTSSLLSGEPYPLRWVDNTGAAWPELRAVLSHLAPERIALNTHQDIGAAGGLHVGEHAALGRALGEAWLAARAVDEPMLAVELVAARVPGQLVYYRMLQETTWVLIEEAFSARVVVPNVTTTEASAAPVVVTSSE